MKIKNATTFPQGVERWCANKSGSKDPDVLKKEKKNRDKWNKCKKQDDHCETMNQIIEDRQAIVDGRKDYIDSGCDAVDWHWDPNSKMHGKTTAASRKKAHEEELEETKTSVKNAKDRYGNCCTTTKTTDPKTGVTTTTHTGKQYN